jgi:molybdate transport system substrate-binding protein
MNRRGFVLALLAGSSIPAQRAVAQHHGTSTTGPADGHGVLVFAAATLKPALHAIVAVYRTKDGGDVTIAYGPSPMLAKQIENGAPADLFVSADPVWMDYLAERRLVRRHTRADLVRNVLVLAGPGDQAATDLAGVVDRAFPLSQVVGAGPLCMCNPADHPAGRYGKASLVSLGLWESVASKIAIVDNPLVAVTMVSRGDAPVAVVFATDVKDVRGARVLGAFPPASHPPIVYPAALTMAAPHSDAAEKLLSFLNSAEVRVIFDSFGYQ